MSHLGGGGWYQKFCHKRMITLKKGGRLLLFYYFTDQLHLPWVFVCVCLFVGGGGGGGRGGGRGGGVKFPLLHFGSAVFWVNIQDSHPSFCSIKTGYYLYISDPFWYFTENVNCFIPAFFSSYFWSKCVKFLLTYNLRSITKQNWHEIHLKILKQCYNIL